MKESKKQPGPFGTDPDSAYAATDPGPPTFGEGAPKDRVVRKSAELQEDVLRAAREFSHLDRETAQRAARIVNQYERDYARLAEEAVASADAESIGVFVETFQRAKPVVHEAAGEAKTPRTDLLPGVRILEWDEEKQRTPRNGAEHRERPNSTPPDSPDAIRASRRAKALQAELAAAQAAMAEPAQEAISDGDRITHPSIHRRRERQQLATLLVVAVVLGIIAWALLKAP